MDDADRPVDGNALAGMLGDVFGNDMTLAHGVCGGCGAAGPLAEAHAYVHSTRAVVRCRGCGEVLMVVVRRHGRYLLGFDRLRSLELPADALP